MGTQQQVQESPVSQKRKGLPWKQVRRVIYILVAIALVFFIVGAIFWILMTLGIIHGPVFDKLFVILNGLGGATIAVLAFFGVIQFILSLIPNPTEPTTTTSSTPSTSTAILPTSSPPQTTPVPQPDKAPYRSIIDLPPPTDSKTIQQRGKAVRQVYDKLTQPDITALVLTGIGGIGKSILAALIYNYAAEQRRTRKGPFTADPLWLRIDPSVTMADIGGTLLEALGKPMPGFGHQSPSTARNQLGGYVLYERVCGSTNGTR
jgi:hypothetical protein